MEIAVGAIVVLIATAAAMFLILVAINIALFLKLRSAIPQQPFSKSEHE
ncbi:hypothetical protein [Mycolicibacterium sp. P9-64]|nr:hypothetical protein [Mycolicibacterium sp. P9-64]